MDPLQELKDRIDTILRELQETIREVQTTRAQVEQHERRQDTASKAPQREADDDDILPTG